MLCYITRGRLFHVAPKVTSWHTKYGTRFHHSDFRYFNSPFGVLFNFPHGTCLLSVSLQYLALDDSYHPIYILRPKNVTPLTSNQTILENTLPAFHRQWEDFPDFNVFFQIQLDARYNSDWTSDLHYALIPFRSPLFRK